MTHAQLSDGVVKDGSFDLPPVVALADARDAVAGALADFITVHSTDDGLNHALFFGHDHCY